MIVIDKPVIHSAGTSIALSSGAELKLIVLTFNASLISMLYNFLSPR